MLSSQHVPSPAAAEVRRQVLSHAARLLASAADFNDTMRQALGACLPALGDFGFFDVVHGDRVIRTVAAHEAPDIEALLAPTQWVRQEDSAMNLCALSTGESALHPDITDSWYRRAAANDGHLALLRQLDFRSMITVPVRYRDELLGALTLFMGRSGRQHGSDDLEFAANAALLAAPAVANTRLVEQHREAEAALRLSQERVRLAVDAGRVGIWDWDVVTGHVEWSDRVYEMYEMAPGSDPGSLNGFRDRVHPDDWARVQATLEAALAGNAAYEMEFRTLLASGTTRWLSTRASVLRDPAGKPLRVVGASIDVTERMALLAAERKARDEAVAARRRLELLARAGDALSRSLDPEETLRTIGETIVPAVADWCRIDLVDDKGVLQRRLAHHSDPARAEQALEMSRQLRAVRETKGSMASVMASGKPHFGHYTPDIADADLRLYTQTFGMGAHYIVPLTARGRTIGVMAVIQGESGRDLDEEDRALILELGQRASLALDNARLYSAAESANRAKDEFLAMLGHELRNPLAPITTALELMARRDAQVHVEERHIIGRQVAHMSRLIDDLLDVSRITRGKIQLLREPVDMRAVVANAIELTRPVFEKHVHGVELDVPDEPAVVVGDAVRLAQVLCNLLTNAAKFTPAQGRVALSLRRESQTIEVTVQDCGNGIDAQLLPHVFELFVQGQQAIDRQAGGLGLGLAIVRTLVEMHGGSVTAHSDGPGRGARFTVRLPASSQAPAPIAAQPPPKQEAAGQGRILVVDDNADAAQTLADLLGVMGYEVHCANHAREALASVQRNLPRVVLLDIGLPDVDGYQLAKLLRELPQGRDLKLVALTGYGRDNDRARSRAAGFDEHLVKPVAIERLLEVLRELLR